MSDGSLLGINIDFLGVGDVLTCTVKIIVEIGSLTLSLIDMKLEYIEALVSAGDIVDALHGDLLGEIAISINDAILIVLEDLADGLTVGANDHSGAEAHALILQPSLGIGITARHLLHGIVINGGGAADAEYLRLESVGAGTDAQAVIVVIVGALSGPGGRVDTDVELLALSNQRIAGQSVRVLAADESADAAYLGVVNIQSGAVAEGPDELLAPGGQQLAVMTDQVPLTVEQQIGVPHGAEGVVALFADTDGEEDLILAGNTGDAIESGAGNGYSVLEQALIEGMLIHGRHKQAPEGEGGDEGLRENNDIGAVFLSFLCLCRHLLDGSVTIQEYRGGLNSGSAQLGHGITNKGNFAHFHLSTHF